MSTKVSAGHPFAEAVSGIGKVFVSQVPLWLSLGLLLLWTTFFLTPSLVTVDLLLLGVGGPLESWVVCLLCFVLSSFVIGLLARHFFFDFKTRRIIVSVSICLALSAVLHHICAHLEGLLSEVLLLLSLLLIGALTPLLFLETVRQFVRSGFKIMLTCAAVATLFISLVFLVLFLAPTVVKVAASALTPLLLAVCLLYSNWESAHTAAPVPVLRRDVRISSKLLVTSLIQGIAYGFGRLCLTQLENFASAPREVEVLVHLAGFVFAALALVVLVTVFKFDFNLLIYKIGFVLLGLGLSALVLDPLRPLGLFVFAAGYRFVDLLIFALVVYLSSAKNLSLNWTLSWPLCMLYLGFMVGYVLLGGLIDLVEWLAVDKLIALVAVAVFLLAIIAVSERNASGAWGFIALSDEHKAMPPHREQVLRDIAQGRGFSARQQEVFELMAEGKTRKEIAGALHLSEETIKVHIHGIYTKLQVHTKRELAELIEAEEKLLVS